MDPKEIEKLIELGIAGANVRVSSADNTHYAVVVVSAEFAGQRAIARHQMIYRTLGPRMGNEIHALSIRAYTPEEWHELAAENGN